MITRPAPQRVHRYACLLLILYLTRSVDFASSVLTCAGVNWCHGPQAPQPPHLPGETAAATRHRCRLRAVYQVRPCPCPHICTHYTPLSCCVIAQAADALAPAYKARPPAGWLARQAADFKSIENRFSSWAGRPAGRPCSPAEQPA